MKPFFHLTIITYFALVNIGNGQAQVPKPPTVKVVSASGTVDLNLQLMLTPEQWERAPQVLMPTDTNGPEGAVVKYPFARHAGFVATKAVAMDVLFVAEDGQVRGVFENISDSGYHAFDKPVIAVIFVPTGLVKKHKIERGNLVISAGFSLAPTVTTTLVAQGEFRSRVEKKLKRSAKKNRTAAAELGAFYLEQRDFKKAAAVYRKLVAADARNGASQIGLAIAYSGAGEVDKATETLIEVISRDGTNEDAYLHLARIFRQVKKVDAIVTVLASGIAAHPGLLGLRLELARLYIALGKRTDAKSILDAAPDTIKEDDARIARVLGDIYLRDGEIAEAVAAYRKYLAVFPSAPHAAELRLFISRHHETKK